MRVFTPVKLGAKLMGRTGDIYPAGSVVKIAGVEVMSYDHKDKLALKIENEDRFLLVEELGADVAKLAHEWSQDYEQMAEWRSKMARAEEALQPLVRKHIKPGLSLVGGTAFAKEGPGIQPVLL
jgi:hypothetical protein